MLPRKDEMVQTGPTELDPTSWSGNQRVQHFGPMAQRDPFFYYYPKGWDILYPAHFGFFPYRTSLVTHPTFNLHMNFSYQVICVVGWGNGANYSLSGFRYMYTR